MLSVSILRKSLAPFVVAVLLLGAGLVPRASHAQAQKPLPFSLPDTTVAAERVGQSITLPITLDTTVSEIEGIQALKVEIITDPSVLTFTGAMQTGTLTAGWPLFIANARGDTIIVAVSTTRTTSLSGGPAPVLLLQADIMGEGTAPLSVTTLLLNEGKPAAAVRGGTVTVGEGELPVEFSGAPHAHLDGHAVVLRWTTLSEANNAGFQVQHRPPTRTSFADVPESFVPSKAPGGRAAEPLSYHFRVEKVQPGRHAFRLRQIDHSGHVAYSPEVEIEIPPRFGLSAPYPNPFIGSTRLDLVVPKPQKVQAAVYNALGQRIQNVWTGSVTETKTLQIDGEGLASGTYLIRVTGETFQAVRRITLVR